MKVPIDPDYIRAEMAKGRSQLEIARALGVDRMRIQRVLAKPAHIPDQEHIDTLLRAIRAKEISAPGYPLIQGLKLLLKRNIPDLLALNDANDPFYAGSPAQTDQARWFLALWKHFGFTHGVHLRRIHYRIVSVDVPYKKADGIHTEIPCSAGMIC